jgi:hypothetical protein
VTDLDLSAIKARIEAASAGPWTAHPDGLVWAPRLGDPVSGSAELEDAEFIAAARLDVPALVAEVERLTRLLGPTPVPSVDSYESMAQALSDERAAVVEHCNRIAVLEALLAEVLQCFPANPYPGFGVRSAEVLPETLDRWRSHLAGGS